MVYLGLRTSVLVIHQDSKEMMANLAVPTSVLAQFQGSMLLPLVEQPLVTLATLASSLAKMQANPHLGAAH